MHKISIISPGKTKESWLTEAINMYTTRLQKTVSFDWPQLKDNTALKTYLNKEKAFFCLDPQGKMFSSQDFHAFLQKHFASFGPQITLVIGAAEGLSPEIKSSAKGLISLSPMTFTHQITRLILVEQIYRSFEIEKGSEYHK